MAALDFGRKRKFKEAPPVPIKTYQWEDVKRERRRGKYPYTYLYKNLLVDSSMEDEKKLLQAAETAKEEEKQPAVDGEKKRKKVVRKVKKVTKEKDTDEPTTRDIEKPIDTALEDTRKIVEEIIPETTGASVEEKSDSNVKSEEVKPTGDAAELLTLAIETRDLATERQTSEDKEVETICAQSEGLKTHRHDETADDDMEIQYEPLIEEETHDKEERTSADVSPDLVSKNTESEDTYTDSNIEQYLDKEEVSKSVSDASGFEGATSVSDVDGSHDRVTPSVSERQASLEVTDLKRKHSRDSSELTKSNVSLFEKMKNAKFKPPTFKIPKFKKFTFTKKPSAKRVKADRKEVKAAATGAEVEAAVQSRRTVESPVYIHIPLNPTPEDLEKERQAASKSEASRRLADTSDSSTDRLNDSKDTNGTLTRTPGAMSSGHVEEGKAATTSKWKGVPSKTDKKSPPFKKKKKKKKGNIGSGKNGSPKSEKDGTSVEGNTSPVTRKRGDSPVQYIYIPLKPPDNETEDKSFLEAQQPFDEIDDAETINTTLVSNQTELETSAKGEELKTVDKPADTEEEIVTATIQSKEAEKAKIEIKHLPKVTTKPDEEKPKGAIKRTTTGEGKTLKDTTTKLTKDIKRIASKWKGVQKKTKRGGSKKSSLKAAPKPVTGEKKTSPKSKKRSDSPTEYIYIPLKGPLPDETPEILGKSNGKQEVQASAVVNESVDSQEEAVEVPKEAETEVMDVEPAAKIEESSKVETRKQPTTDEPMETEPMSQSTALPTKSEPVKLESQKLEDKVQVEEAKKSTFMSKLKGFKAKTEKKSPPAIKKGIKQFTSKKPSPKSPKKETSASKQASSPAVPVKSSDSPVEYIYIPLKPVHGEGAEELPVRSDSTAAEDQMTGQASTVDSVPETEAAVECMEVNGTTTERDTAARVTTNGDASATEQDTSPSTGEWKGFKPKTEKKSPPAKRKKPGKGSPSLEKRDERKTTSVLSKKRDSPPVEYIHIPLTPVEGEEKTEKPETANVQTAEAAKQTDEKPSEMETTKLEAQESKAFESKPLKLEETPKECEPEARELEEKAKVDVMKPGESNVVDTKAEKVAEKPKVPQKENILAKLKGLKPKKGQAPKPGDKSKKETVSEKPPLMVLGPSDAPVEYIFIPLKSEGTEESDLKPEESKESEQPTVRTDNKVEEPKKEIKEESPLTAKETAKEQVKLETTTPVTKTSAAPAEVAKKSKVQDNTEEARQIKEAVLKKWQGFKTKPLQKPMPLKRKDPKKTSPKSEQKPATPPKSKDQPPMVVKRSDSPVEYIYIPLNPTQEQLDFEQEMEEKQRLLAPEPRTPARTPQVTPRPVKKPMAEEDATAKQAAVQRGAIKKQPADKGNKLKDTTTKLTEDIKKFALKLKDMQKKSRKPTFKAFKRGSKSGSKTMSPTASKKVTTPVDTKSPPPQAIQRGDSPVEYFYIPLKPTPAEEQAERELKLKREAEAQASLPDEQLAEDATDAERKEVPRKPVIVEAIEKKGKKDSVESLKKTREFGKSKLKALKDAVHVSKEKKGERTRRISRDSPEYVFIPLKELEKPEAHANETVTDEPADVKPAEIQAKLDEPLPKEEPEQKAAVPDEPHYEPLTKEDEEDGLKTAIIASLSEVKPGAEEQAFKSVLKTEDSPRMNKKVSFDASKAQLAEEQSTDENVIYETIQIKGEPVTRQPVTVANVSVDDKGPPQSLRDDCNNWSKSTDHEYEPVNPPPEIDAAPASLPEVARPVRSTVTDTDLEPTAAAAAAAAARVSDKYKDSEVIAQQQQQLTDTRLLRIPLDKELVVAGAQAEDAISSDKSVTESFDTPDSRRQLLQQRVLGTPDISSRTDGISTSQLDSSALEHLPLKKEDRPKPAKMAQTEEHGPNIQEKIRNQAGKLKTKIKGMKKPSFTIPNPKFSPKFRTPKFQRPKLHRQSKSEKAKFTMPKMPTMPAMPKLPKLPDRPKMSLPSFSLPRPANLRRQRSAEDRHISTTASSADSKPNIFDFRTYPRFFDRTKTKNKKQPTKGSNVTTSGESETRAPEFATVPRAAARKKGPVGSRWVHRFTDIEYADAAAATADPRQMYNVELQSKDRGDSLERRMEADLRYELALAEAEADEEMREYERENQDISRHSQYHAGEFTDRWKHGSFRDKRPDEIDEFDSEIRNGVDHDQQQQEQQQENLHDERSSVASSGHRGVIEEIDSDQFFLREKGISQDNIQVGLYLSSEIRDAFRQPVNALSQMQDVPPGYGSRDYELDASDLSLARPNRPKRKHLKRAKRVRKTPHASEENIPYDRESVNTEPEEQWSRDENDYKTFPPARPRRHRKQKTVADDEKEEEEEEPVDDEVHLNLENLRSQEDLPNAPMAANIIGYVEKDLDLLNDEYNKYLQDEEALMYENEIMKDIEQPEIVISADQKYEIAPRDVDRYLEDMGRVTTPKPPTRRHKSLKSLTVSEHDSIMGEFNKDRVMQDILEQELNVYRIEHEYLVPVDGAPVVPHRRSRSRTVSQAEDDRTSHGAESLVSECHEPECMQDVRDAMGYAIIERNKPREAPLPSAPRRRRSTKSNRSARSADTKFFTVPRPLNDTPPARPQRNYSTLGPNRPPRKRSELDVSQTEEKENIDITQYIEIEDDDEHNRDLQSGEVISKMKGRPLPAPPRPPRKTRDRSKEALRDITQETNIISDSLLVHEDEDKLSDISPASPMEAVEEIEVSTQTDPLPDDFCCEEIVEEPTDRIVAPTRRKRSVHQDGASVPRRSGERPKTPIERSVSPNAMVIERQVQTPVHEDTVTHASLLVRPVPDYPPDSYVSKRFAADIPDIYAAPRSDEAEEEQEEVIEEEIVKETRGEVQAEKIVPTPIYSEVSKRPKDVMPDLGVDEPTGIPAERFTLAPMASVDSDTILSSSGPVEPQEEASEMPAKPQRRKSQAQVQSTMKPEPPAPAPAPAPPPPSISPQPQIIERIIERQVPVCVTPGPDTEVEVLRAQRLQVTDLDVERLNVTELQAQKILVSEIDGVTLQISELSSKSGNLVVNGLEIPSGLIQEILDRLQPSTGDQTAAPAPTVEQVSTQTNGEDAQEHTETVKLAEAASTSLEQVATQTRSLEQSAPVPVSTQTSLDELQAEPVLMEPVSTQTSIDEPDVAPVMEQVATQTSGSMETIEAEDFNCPDLIPAAELVTQQAVPPAVQIVVPLVAEEETEEEPEDFTPAQLMDLQSDIDDIIGTACEHLNRDAAYINEMLLDSLRFDVPEQFSPTMSDEMLIDLPGHVIIETEDPVTGEPIYLQHALDDSLPPEIREMIEREMEIERQSRGEQQSIQLFAAGSPHLVELVEIPEEQELEEEEMEKQKRTESPLPGEDSEVPEAFKQLKDREETLVEVLEKPGEVEKKEESIVSPLIEDRAVPKQVQALKDEEEQLIDLLTGKREEARVQEEATGQQQQQQQAQSPGTKKNSDETNIIQMKSEQPPEDSVIPRQFRELKDDQEAIIVQLQKEIARTQELLQKEMNIEVNDKAEGKLEEPQMLEAVLSNEESLPQAAVPPAIPPLPKQHHQEPQPQAPPPPPPPPPHQLPTKPREQQYNEQTESSSAQSHSPPTRPPLPQQEHLPEAQPQAPIIHSMPYPVPYYPEYVHSVPPQSFYTLRSPQARDVSEEDIPVHHRRRRHHRHLSRSSSDEDRRTVSRRARSISTEPSIPQLTGQLARAYMISVGRAFRQLTSYLSTSVLGTPEAKQHLQIALIILLVLIAGLILISLGGGETVHLHHWEYFNPPKEL